jgi:hypothetical protein
MKVGGQMVNEEHVFFGFKSKEYGDNPTILGCIRAFSLVLLQAWKIYLGSIKIQK